MPFYVYVLRSLRDERLYTGMTSNLDQRIKQHNAGQTKSLRHRRPLILAYAEQFATRSEAVARERFFKTPEGGALKAQLVARAERSGSVLE